MAKLCPFAFYTVIDSNGDPISGAKLESYVAGTTTAQSTYSDEGLTTANDNPASGGSSGNQVANSIGRFGAMFMADAEYKFILKDADDVTIFTIDNVNSEASAVLKAASVTAVKALDSDANSDNDILFTLGNASAGDGYGGEYYWSSTSTATDDTTTTDAPAVIRPTDTGAGLPGRWLRRGVKEANGEYAESVQQHLADAHALPNANINGIRVANRNKAANAKDKTTQLSFGADFMLAPNVVTPIPWDSEGQNPYSLWESPSYVLPIHAITQANPAVVTAYGNGSASALHSALADDRVRIYGVGGMTEINGAEDVVASVNAAVGTGTITLTDTNSSAYTAYSGHGWIAKGYPERIKMTRGVRQVRLRGTIAFGPKRAYLASAFTKPVSNVRIPAVDHNFVEGDTLTVFDTGSDLDGNTYTVSASNLAADYFELDSTSGISTVTYAGGYVSHVAGTSSKFGTPKLKIIITKNTYDTSLTDNIVHEESFEGLGDAYTPVISFETKILDVTPPRPAAIQGISKANPGVITAKHHGITGTPVLDISGVLGMTEINGREPTVASVTDDTITTDLDTSAFSTYTKGGIVQAQGDYFVVHVVHDKSDGLALLGAVRTSMEVEVVQRDDDSERRYDWFLFQGSVAALETRAGGVDELASDLSAFAYTTLSQSTTEGNGSLPKETTSDSTYSDILNGGASTPLLDGYHQNKYDNYQTLHRKLRNLSQNTISGVYIPATADAPPGSLAGQHYPYQAFTGDGTTTAFTLTTPTSVAAPGGGTENVVAPLAYFVATALPPTVYQPNFKIYWNGSFVGYNNTYTPDDNTTVSASDGDPENATSFATTLTGETPLNGQTYTVTVSGGAGNGQLVADRYDTITISPAPPAGLDLRILYDVDVANYPWVLEDENGTPNNYPINIAALVKKNWNRALDFIFMDLMTPQHVTAAVRDSVIRVCHEHGFNVVFNATVASATNANFTLQSPEIREGDGIVIEGFGVKLGVSSISDTQTVINAIENFRYKGIRMFAVMQEQYVAGKTQIDPTNPECGTALFEQSVELFEQYARPGDGICYTYSDLGTLTNYGPAAIYTGPDFERP